MEMRRQKRLQLFRGASQVLERQAGGDERLPEITVAYLEKMVAALSRWLDDESEAADREFLAVLEEFRDYLEGPARTPASTHLH